jgi:hypothetical protein
MEHESPINVDDRVAGSANANQSDADVFLRELSVAKLEIKPPDR